MTTIARSELAITKMNENFDGGQEQEGRVCFRSRRRVSKCSSWRARSSKCYAAGKRKTRELGLILVEPQSR